MAKGIVWPIKKRCQEISVFAFRRQIVYLPEASFLHFFPAPSPPFTDGVSPPMLSPDLAYGSGDRLLPPSVPYRFFGAALVFHLLGWLTLLLTPDPLAGFTGGQNSVLAGLHLLTLGVLATTAMGAGYQLLPMATVRPVRSVGWSKASFWTFVPGVLGFAAGLAHQHLPATLLGAALLATGLTIFAVLTLDNMRQTGEMPLVGTHVRVAMTGLALTLIFGLLLLANLAHGFLPDHRALAAAHVAVAVYGFMGMLVFGFSSILIPMLALARAPDAALSRKALLAGTGALGLAAAGGISGIYPLLALAALMGGAAASLHVWIMVRVLKTRMRKTLGFFFWPIRIAWGLLPLSLGLGLLAALDLLPGNGGALFVIAAVPGWLLLFLFGILQRILPFLASVHVSQYSRRPPLVSALAPEAPLKAHLVCHLAAVALLLLAAAGGWEPLARLGAALGAIGAIAFLGFAGLVYRRTRACLALAQAA